MEKSVLITGATGGLGYKSALALAAEGFHVFVGGRRPQAVGSVVEEIIMTTRGTASPFLADLSDLDQVRIAVQNLGERNLTAVVANAGISLDRYLESAQGYELTFAVNVLSHHLLFNLLRDHIEDRIVIVSSGVHDPDNKLARRSGVPAPRWVGAEAVARPQEAEPGKRIDDTRLCYSNSKLANVLQARELQRRSKLAGRQVDVFAIDPGLMVDTDFARSYSAMVRGMVRILGTIATPFVDNMRSSTTTARHVTRLVTDDRLSGTGFQYFDGDKAQPPSLDAQRDDYARTLWTDANRLVRLNDGEEAFTAS
ncbi:MAG: SDR family NAD(P)-dependent oxidoreductase [Rubrobacteraceae bacterium]